MKKYQIGIIILFPNPSDPYVCYFSNPSDPYVCCFPNPSDPYECCFEGFVSVTSIWRPL